MTSEKEGFAELLGRSCFSFLEGASHPEELVERASELGLAAFGICDRDGLYGVVRAHTEAKKHNQRLLIGAELTVEGIGPLELEAQALTQSTRRRVRRGRRRAPERVTRPKPPPTVALIAEDHDGYSNLCGLLTEAHERHEKGTAGISVQAIARAARGLSAVVPLTGPSIIDDAFLGPLHEAFGDRLLGATWRHLDRGDLARTAAALAAQVRYGIRTVATARPSYHHPARKPLADVLCCIRNKTTLDAAGTWITPNAEAFLRSASQMRSLFRDHPDWVERSLEVAQRCRFSLSELRYAFPTGTLCAAGETPDDALRRLTEKGLLDRYPEGVPAGVRAQVDKELDLIARLSVAPYFLSVYQIVCIARERRILCQGRGSAANSAVCFALGITAVDPARSNLLFERFLSAERAEPPDIDVDFEHERREEVIQAIYQMYGRDRAAMVSEIIAYRGKSALREVGKAFGLALDQVDRLSGLVMHMDSGITPERVSEAGLDPDDRRIQQVFKLAAELEGFPRHLSIHVGGFVLSSDPLRRVAPVEPARMEGRTVIPWDKDDLDDLGFFKIDLLALGILTAIRKALALGFEQKAKTESFHKARAAGGLSLQLPAGAEAPAGAILPDRPQRSFDPIAALAAIPPEDPAVYEMIQRADTVGVFQIESRAQMAMLPRLKPTRFYDLVIEVAIVRPGPIQGGMVHPYLRRRTGEEAPISPHPCLDPILERTLGVPLFQEQVMQIAMVGAGYTPGEADQLRRDMAAWKKHGRLERHRARLLSGFADRGISQRFGEMLFNQIEGFAEYGFPESHAASFALLVYASAWLKARRPAPFACALLNSQPMGFYSPSVIVQDAQRHGVRVLSPSVLRSDWDSTLEDLGDGGGAAEAREVALRLGLRLIRGFGEGAAIAIMQARSEGPLSSIEDLVHRASLKKNEVEALAEAGALEELVPGRREALWRARAPREGGLFEGKPIEEEKAVGLPKLRRMEQLLLDYGRVGLSVDDHPMKHLRSQLNRKGVARAVDLKQMIHGEGVRVAGLVIGRQRPDTASGVTFITLEDETGMVNLVVFKRLFEEFYMVARHAQMMLVSGRLERQGEVIHVIAQSLEKLRFRREEEPLPMRSRDFH
ncbi:MAG TPA: error-prone DNA polymerase [Polyangiaceae bacterium]|nr:error-prone DNA polymerase [Polyangiaceae bacterium]